MPSKRSSNPFLIRRLDRWAALVNKKYLGGLTDKEQFEMNQMSLEIDAYLEPYDKKVSSQLQKLRRQRRRAQAGVYRAR